MSYKFKIGEPVRLKNRVYRVVARLSEAGAYEPRYRIRNEEVDEERCGFRRSRPGIPIEGGQHSNRRRAVLARRHVHGVTALMRRQDRIVWLRSFGCCLLST